MNEPDGQRYQTHVLRESLDECAGRMNGEILHFRADGTPSPETERILRSVRRACDRFWAKRRALKLSKKNLLPDSTR